METISLQPMADQEIGQVSGGVLPIVAIGAIKVVGFIAGSAAFSLAASYLYVGVKRRFSLK